MKKFKLPRGKMIQTVFIVCAIFLSSCDFIQKPKDSKVATEDKNELKFDNINEENDAQFLVNAAEINLEKIQLAKLAQKNGRAPHIKELGQKIEYNHSESQKDLVALARSKRISIPTSISENTQEAFKRLNNKSGNDFDKAYAEMMVDKHSDAIETFEKATIESKDVDIRNWATASLPKLRAHLNHSIECKKKCDKS